MTSLILGLLIPILYVLVAIRITHFLFSSAVTANAAMVKPLS